MEMEGQIDTTAALPFGIGSRIRLKCMLDGPQIRSGPVGIQALGCPTLSLVTTPTKISILYNVG